MRPFARATSMLLVGFTLLFAALLFLSLTLGPGERQWIEEKLGFHQDYSTPRLSLRLTDDDVMSLDKLNDDVLMEICSHVRKIQDRVDDAAKSSIWRALGWEEITQLSALKSLSMANNRLRSLTSPELFRSVAVDGSWAEASRGLRVVEGCPAMLANVRDFKFKVFNEFDVGPKPPRNLAKRLADILQQMPKLDKLTVALPEFHTEEFETAFIIGNVSLPKVKAVVLGTFCDFIIQHCPNVEAVSSTGWEFLHSKRGTHYDVRHPEAYWLELLQADGQRVLNFSHDASGRYEHASRLISAAGKAKNVTYFELNQWWEAYQVQQVYEHLPYLRFLAMSGGQYGGPPEEYLPIIGRFEQLEELALADASNLQVGFDPPMCGNMYMGPDGDALAERVEAEGRTAAGAVAVQVYKANKNLKRVWIGDYARAEVIRDEDGGIIDLSWTYESRKNLNGWVV